MSARCVILGAGGHARVLLDCLLTSDTQVHGLLDNDRALWGTMFQGTPVLGGDALLPALAQQGITHFLVGMAGTGDNMPRQRLFALGCAQPLMPLTVSHPTAVCSSWARVGAGSVLAPQAVVNANAVLGVNVIINTGAIIEHDCYIGDHVHVATGARLAGAVQVEDGAHVGAGAVIRQGIRIGAGAIVGAGAAVVNDVNAWTTVVGVPARLRATRVQIEETQRA